MLKDIANIVGAKLLLVDDKQENLQVLAMIFNKFQPELLFARSGEEALALAESQKPNIILLDIMMPGMDGFEVCTRLKQNVNTKDIPVIFLTAKSDREDIVKGFNVGGVDYITKPFCKEEIIARVNTHLKIGRLHTNLKSSLSDAVVKQDALRNDLKIAAEIQRSLLPPKQLDIPGIEAAWIYKPSASVGGDLLNIVPLINNYIAFYMLDVSGHGVPSSLIAVTVAQHLLPHTGNLLRRREGRVMVVSPSDVLVNLDKQFPFDRFNKFFTIFYGVLNVESGALTYSIAGHPPGILQRKNGDIETLKAGGTVIGAGVGIYNEETIDLRNGDKLFLYTDGVVEMENDESELFGVKRLTGCVKQNVGRSGEETLEYINNVLKSYAHGKEAEDDVSMMSLEYQPEMSDTWSVYSGADIKAQLI